MIVSFLSYTARFCSGRHRPLQLCSQSSGRPTRQSHGLQVASAGCAKRKQSARPLGEGVLNLLGRAVRPLDVVYVGSAYPAEAVNYFCIGSQNAPKMLQNALKKLLKGF